MSVTPKPDHLLAELSDRHALVVLARDDPTPLD